MNGSELENPNGAMNATAPDDSAGGEAEILQASLDFLKENALVIIIAVVITALLLVCCVCWCRLRGTNCKCWRKKNKDQTKIEEMGLKADFTDSAVTSEVNSHEYIAKRPSSAENNLRLHRRKRAETRSIIDMLDTTEWLKRILEEEGANDEFMQEIRSLMRRLRELKNSTVSEDESDFEIAYMMSTPSAKNTAVPKFKFPPPPPPSPPHRPAANFNLDTKVVPPVRDNSELWEIKTAIDNLSDRVGRISGRNALILNNGHAADVKRPVTNSVINRPFMRQTSSFSSSSLVCMEQSPSPDSCFDIPPSMTDNLRTLNRENSVFGNGSNKSVTNIPPPPPNPRAPGSFNRVAQLKKDLGNSKHPLRKQISFHISGPQEDEFDLVDYPQIPDTTSTLTSGQPQKTDNLRKSNFQLSPIPERGEKSSPQPTRSLATDMGNGSVQTKVMQEMQDLFKKMPRTEVENKTDASTPLTQIKTDSASQHQLFTESRKSAGEDELDLLGKQIEDLLAWSSSTSNY